MSSHIEYALEASTLNTIKFWLNLIPEDKVIERDVVLASVTDIWVTYNDIEKASLGLFNLLNNPVNALYAKKLKTSLGITPDELHNFVHEINQTLGDTVKLINDNVPRYTVKNEMTVRQASILEFARDIVKTASVLSSFLVNFTYVVEATTETKERERIIKTATPTLRRAIKEMRTNLSKQLESISKLSNSLKVLNNLSAMNKGNVSIGGTNFGNPIWSLRKFFVDRDKLTYDKLKVEAQLLEIRILSIQTTTTPNMEERIAYFEEKLASITRKMKALERQYESE